MFLIFFSTAVGAFYLVTCHNPQVGEQLVSSGQCSSSNLLKGLQLHVALIFVEPYFTPSNLCQRITEFIQMVTGVLQELEKICLKSNSHERNHPERTRSTSCQTSVTPGFASILYPFLLRLIATSAFTVQLFASYCFSYRWPCREKRKDVTTSFKKPVTVMKDAGSHTDTDIYHLSIRADSSG